MNLKSVFVRVLAILAFAMAICWSSQAAQPSSTGSGRLVVQRSPAIGSSTFLKLSIDGEVHDLQAGSRYDQLIPAGHHVLMVDTPGNQHKPTSMELTVDPGMTYAFTAVRGSRPGYILAAIEEGLPRQAGRNPIVGRLWE